MARVGARPERREKVVIVVGNVTHAMDLALAFETAGFIVTTCGTVGAGCEAVSEHRFDLLVMEHELPDGYAALLLRLVRAMPGTAKLPILALCKEEELRSGAPLLSLAPISFLDPESNSGQVVEAAERLLRPRPAAPIIVPRKVGPATGTAAAAPSSPTNGGNANGTSPSSGTTGASAVPHPSPSISAPTSPSTSTPSGGVPASRSGPASARAPTSGVGVSSAPGSLAPRSSLPASERPNKNGLTRAARILCVDDSATYRYSLKKLLTAEGYEVLMASSGEDALERLSRESVDCVLLDRMMPGLSGLETCKILKQTPEWRNIPVVMLTATEKREAIIEGLNAGADDYIAKSSDAEVLRGRVRAQVRRKHFEDENRAIREELHRKDIESAREQAANRAKGVFLAVMSHEIRTPMNAIIGMTELVLKTELHDDQRDLLSSVMSSAESLLHLLNDILDFSKIEAGKLELDPIDYRIRYALGDVMNALALQAGTKGLELAAHVAPNVPDALIGDPGRLRQVIVNLVGNAIKFTDKGEVIVSVVAEETKKDSVFLHFSVRDTGIGIEPAKQKVIFQPFEQADGTMTRRFGGTGLGLAISAKLVEMMGGKIWVESTPGKGSIFHFTGLFGLQAHPSVDQLPAMAERARGTRILVVDDSATQRTILQEMLGQFTSRVTVAADGPTALTAMERALSEGEPFELVLIDTEMPVMSGHELCEQIRQRPAHARTGIVLLAQSGMRSDTIKWRELGVGAYLRKPVRQSELLDAILMALEGAHLRNERGRVGGGQSAQPLPLPSRPAPAAAPTPYVSVQGTSRSLRILLAEDNAVNRKFATLLLEKLGHHITVAVNGRQAVDMHRAQQFDVILMDVQMPEMDGLEATGAIRSFERGSGNHISIIAMTAEALKGDRERCLDAGCDDYLTKPIRSEELTSALERWGKTIPPTAFDEDDQEGTDVGNPTPLLPARGPNGAAPMRGLPPPRLPAMKPISVPVPPPPAPLSARRLQADLTPAPSSVSRPPVAPSIPTPSAWPSHPIPTSSQRPVAISQQPPQSGPASRSPAPPSVAPSNMTPSRAPLPVPASQGTPPSSMTPSRAPLPVPASQAAPPSSMTPSRAPLPVPASQGAPPSSMTPSRVPLSASANPPPTSTPSRAPLPASLGAGATFAPSSRAPLPVHNLSQATPQSGVPASGTPSRVPVPSSVNVPRPAPSAPAVSSRPGPAPSSSSTMTSAAVVRPSAGNGHPSIRPAGSTAPSAPVSRREGVSGAPRPAFVLNEALTRAAGDKDLLREAIAILLDDAPQQLRTLRDAYSTKDLQTVQRLAHGLQGAVANLGATSMAAGLRDLSHAARDHRQDAIDPLLDQAHRDWASLERELRVWMHAP